MQLVTGSLECDGKSVRKEIWSQRSERSSIQSSYKLGYGHLQDKLYQAVSEFVSGKDIFASPLTGGEKSLCYAVFPPVFDSLCAAIIDKGGEGGLGNLVIVAKTCSITSWSIIIPFIVSQHLVHSHQTPAEGSGDKTGFFLCYRISPWLYPVTQEVAGFNLYITHFWVSSYRQHTRLTSCIGIVGKSWRVITCVVHTSHFQKQLVGLLSCCQIVTALQGSSVGGCMRHRQQWRQSCTKQHKLAFHAT